MKLCLCTLCKRAHINTKSIILFLNYLFTGMAHLHLIAVEAPQAAETVEVESSTMIDLNDLICKPGKGMFGCALD